MRMVIFVHFLMWLVNLAAPACSFVSRTAVPRGREAISLYAKKKKKAASNAKGFSKSGDLEANLEVKAPESISRLAPAAPAPEPDTQPFLRSVGTGGSDAAPVEEDLPPEERAKQILREKYGMKSLEEQRMDAKQLERLQERQKQMKEWGKKAKQGEDFEIMTMIPPPLLIAIDRFLKGGVVVTGVLFIGAGLGITVEAWSKTSGQALPEDLESFITNTIEPNFTPGLFILLGFSISLGLFAAAQLGSSGAQYREDK